MDDAEKTIVMPVAEPPAQGAAAPPPTRKSRVDPWMWVAIALLVLLVGVGAAFALGAFSPSSLPQVPDVTGSTVVAGAQTLLTAGYSLGSQLATASDTIAKGLVVSTVPTAGTQLAKGQAVALVVSTGTATSAVPTVSPGTQPGGTGGTGGTGTRMVTVPDVRGKTRNDAVGVLKALGFGVNSVSQSSSTVASGTVISQDPLAGSSKPKGSSVTITVSSGQGKRAAVPGLLSVPQVTVPDLSDQPKEAVAAELTALGLTPHGYGGVSKLPSSQLVGIVYHQVPAPGTKVPLGYAVQFTYYQ